MKKQFAISFSILLIGWFPFMFLCAFASGANIHVFWRGLIALIGFMCCFGGGFSVVSLLSDTNFWLSQKELDETIAENKKTTDELNIVKEKLLKKLEDE